MPSSRIAGKIARRAFLKIAVRVTLVRTTLITVAFSGSGYSHILSSIEAQTGEQLEKYGIERRPSESQFLALAGNRRNERHIASISNDVLLDRLVERT